IETMVLLNEARTLAMPETTFFEPLALRTLIAPSSSFRRSSAVGCLATPPTVSLGGAAGAAAASALGAPSAGAAPSAAGALGARGFFSPLGAGAAPAAASAAGALTGFSFLGADSSAMVNYSFALVTPTVLRGPLRVRALVLVRWPRTGRLRRWRTPRYEPISISRLMFIEMSLRRSPSTP